MYIYKYIVKLSSEGGKNNKSTTKFESKPYKELSKQNQKGHSRLQNIVVPLGQDQAVVKSSSQNLLTLREVWVPKSCFQTKTWGRQIQFETCKQEKTGLSLHMFQVTCSCFFSLDFFKAWGGFFFFFGYGIFKQTWRDCRLLCWTCEKPADYLGKMCFSKWTPIEIISIIIGHFSILLGLLILLAIP